MNLDGAQALVGRIDRLVWALVLLSLALATTRDVGWFSLVAAVVLGVAAALLVLAHRHRRVQVVLVVGACGVLPWAVEEARKSAPGAPEPAEVERTEPVS